MGLHPGISPAKSMEKSPLNPVPSGSLPSPTVTVKGAPVVAVTIVPSSHPPVRVDRSAPEFFMEGRSHINVPLKTWRMSKSQAPSLADLINIKGTAIEFKNV